MHIPLPSQKFPTRNQKRNKSFREKFAIVRARSPARETRALPGYQTLRPNFLSNSASEIWIMVGRPCGQQ